MYILRALLGKKNELQSWRGRSRIFPEKRKPFCLEVFSAFPCRAGLWYRMSRHQQREPLFQGCMESCMHGTACWQGTTLKCVTLKAHVDFKGDNSCREGSSLSKNLLPLPTISGQICTGITQH